MEAARRIPEGMSTAEFLLWDAPGKLWQLIEGAPTAMAPGSRTHGTIQAEIARLLVNHLAERGSPCAVVTAPGIVPRVRAAQNFRIPDLGVTCASYAQEEIMLQEPLLLIEVLSPSTKAETWSNVWTYTTIPSVREILIVCSDEIGAELIRRRPDGTWPEQAVSVSEGPLTLDSIEFTFDLAALYRGTRLADPDHG